MKTVFTHISALIIATQILNLAAAVDTQTTPTKPGFNFKGIARVQDQRVITILNWLQDSIAPDAQLFFDLVMAKLGKIADRIDSIALQAKEKLNPEQHKALTTIATKIKDQIERMKNLPVDARNTWRTNLDFKFNLDQIPHELAQVHTKLESTIPSALSEELTIVREKAAKFVEWLKSMPAEDAKALDKAIQGKVQKLEKRITVLKQLGKEPQYQEIKQKIEDFLNKSSNTATSIKDRAIELFKKAHESLLEGSK